MFYFMYDVRQFPNILKQCKNSITRKKKKGKRKENNNSRKSVSFDSQTPGSGLNERGAVEVFKPTSRCLEIG